LINDAVNEFFASTQSLFTNHGQMEPRDLTTRVYFDECGRCRYLIGGLLTWSLRNVTSRTFGLVAILLTTSEGVSLSDIDARIACFSLGWHLYSNPSIHNLGVLTAMIEKFDDIALEALLIEGFMPLFCGILRTHSSIKSCVHVAEEWFTSLRGLLELTQRMIMVDGAIYGADTDGHRIPVFRRVLR
jgi:hypothetical protein